MKIIKLAVISFILLFVVITAFSLFIPSDIRISKAINIGAKKDSIWSKVGNVDTWPQWNSLSPDPKLVWIKKGTDEHIAGIKTGPGSSLLSGWKCIEHAGSDSVTIQWYLDFQLAWYPWEKFRSLLFEKTYGLQMEEGLANLKSLLENQVER